MNGRWMPRFTAAVAWGVLALLVLAACWMYRSAVPRAVRQPPLAAPALRAGEDTRIARALRQLQTLPARAAAWRARPTDMPEPPLIPPAPRGRPGPPAADTGQAGEVPSLVLLQSGNRIEAHLQGRPVRVGQTLDNGDTVLQIASSFITVKPQGGDLRRIDMNGRFMPRPASPSPKENTP